MANNTNNKKKGSRSNGNKKTTVKKQAEELSQEQLAHKMLPPYQPIDFSTPPAHLEVVNKKIRALRKKLRKIYEIEQAVKDGSKKITKEQQNSLSNKQALERNLQDFEEIKTSMEQIDYAPQVKMLLGIFFAAAATQSEALINLSTLLLPPSQPHAGYNPLQELQHACDIAEQFLSASKEQIFDNPPTTHHQLQDEVRTFLIPKDEPVTISTKEDPIPVVVEESVSPVQEETDIDESEPESIESVKSNEEPTKEETETENEKEESSPVAEGVKEEESKSDTPIEGNKDDSETAEQSKTTNPKKRGMRGKPRGYKQGDRGYKRGRGGKHNSDRNSSDKDNKSDKPEREGNNNKRGRGRGGRGRGNNRSKQPRDNTNNATTPKDSTKS